MEHGQLYEQVVHGWQVDWLTGLPNRPMLADRLQRGMVTAQRQGELLAVCCLGLDHFQQVNDGLGHELGDAFLKMISERLNLSIRERDTLARQGGDEFLMVLRDLKDASDAVHICQRLLHDVRAAISAGGPFRHHKRQHWYRHLSRPRRIRRSYCCATRIWRCRRQNAPAEAGLRSILPLWARRSQRAAEMAGALLDALAKSQFRMVYQPVFTTEGEIVAFEALLRWQHPTLGPGQPCRNLFLLRKKVA